MSRTLLVLTAKLCLDLLSGPVSCFALSRSFNPFCWFDLIFQPLYSFDLIFLLMLSKVLSKFRSCITLTALGYLISRWKTRKLMREAFVTVRYRKKYKVTTTAITDCRYLKTN